MTAKEVIDRYYETVNAGRWNEWLELFDDNIVIDEQLAGHLEGIEVLRGAIGGIGRSYNKFIMHPLHIVIEGNEVCVIWRFEGANASDVPIEARGANYFRMENGKITYMENFHDTRPFDPFVNQQLD